MKDTSLVLLGIRRSFHPKGRTWIFLFTSVLSVAILFMLPVVTTPGNSIAYQWSIMRWIDVVLLVLFSFLIGLVIVLQIENWRCCRTCKTSAVAAFSQGGTSTAAAGLTALLATATCSACLAGILGIIGLGGAALTLLDYRIPVMIVLLLLTGLSVVCTARKIGCGACRMSPHSLRP